MAQARENERVEPPGGRSAAWFRPLRRRSALLLGFAFAAAAFALGMTFPNPTPQFDEFYHLLTAESLRLGEGFRITPEAEPYDRAWMFTRAVYLCQEWFGPTLTAARVPSAVCWGLALGGVVCWVARRVGLAAALLSGLLLGGGVHALMYSTMVRFYTPHALFVWIAAACVEAAVPRLRPAAGQRDDGANAPARRRLERRGHDPAGRRVGASVGRTLGYLLLGTAAAGMALGLQPTTLIAAGAAGAWLVLAWLFFLARASGPGSARLIVAAGTIAAVALLAAGAWFGIIANYFEEVTAGTRIWAAANADDDGYYLRTLTGWYGPFLSLLPLWAAAALFRGGPDAPRRRRAVGFLLVMGLLPVLVHSFVPTKAFRYVFYALPFLLSVTGIGLAELLRLVLSVRGWLPAGWNRGADRGLGRWAVPGALAAVVALAGFYCLRRAPAITRGVAAAAGWEVRVPYSRSDWIAALPKLMPAAAEADCVVASAGVKALFWLGRLDANLAETLRLDPDPDWLQPQDGRPVITEPEELFALRAAHPSGLVIVETTHWRQSAFVSDRAADALEDGFDPLPLDPAWKLMAFTWGIRSAELRSAG